MSYYGGSDGDRHDANAAELIAEVAELADKDVDYKDYDSDGDGMVDFCYVIYAGYGEAHGADENTIWPHAWNLMSGTGSALKLDGVKINSYACSCELTGNSGKTIDGIGTICHEFSHTLGLPDFYDTANSGNAGMGYWSLMGSGNYNLNGCVPCAYTAYERMLAGWLTPEELEEKITDKTKMIIINCPNNPTGKCLSRQEAEELESLLKDHPGVFLLSAEIYERIVYAGHETVSPASFPSIAFLSRRCHAIVSVEYPSSFRAPASTFAVTAS